MSGDGGYAIWQAAHKGDRDGLTRLVELGMDVNARDEVSTTQRLQPCAAVHAGLVPYSCLGTLALTHGGDYRLQEGYTAIILAAASGTACYMSASWLLLSPPGSSGSPGSCLVKLTRTLASNQQHRAALSSSVCARLQLGRASVA